VSLKTQPAVIEQRHGRGSSRRVLLISTAWHKQWLARVAWSDKRKLWIVTKGGNLALDKVVASAHDFESARELAHKVATL
jgi:hypothetical protein